MADSPYVGDITRVVVDKEILNSFKGRAARTYPVEHGEVLWGFIEGKTAYITSIERAYIEEADTDGLDMDSMSDPGDKNGDYIQLGSIHSHPDEPYWPSPTDIEGAVEPPNELVMGICGITRVSATRRQISFGFFLPTGTPLEVCIAENGKLRIPKA